MIILAHRGLPAADRPENTVAAVRAAVGCGADGVEVDLRLTEDGVLAVSHDPDLARLAGRSLQVAATGWLELREAAAAGGVVLARLEEVLLAARDRRVVLELKEPPAGTGDRTALVLVRRLQAVQSAGALPQVTVSSFSADLLGQVRALLPSGTARTALLGRPRHRPSALLRTALEAGHDEIQPHVRALRSAPEVVGAAHRLGVAVCPWTVNRPGDVLRCERLGVDAVITDDPVAVGRAVGALAPGA